MLRARLLFISLEEELGLCLSLNYCFLTAFPLFLHSLTSLAAAKSLQSCPTVRPHRRQPTRLPRPWDSPGKNTGVGCHFLLQCMKVKVKLFSRIRLLVTPWTAAYQAPPSMGFSRQEYWSGVPLPKSLITETCVRAIIVARLRSQNCCCSITKLYLTLCDPMDYSTPGFPVLHCLLESSQTHVH